MPAKVLNMYAKGTNKPTTANVRVSVKDTERVRQVSMSLAVSKGGTILDRTI